MKWQIIELAPCPLCGGQMQAFERAGGQLGVIQCIEPRATGIMTFKGPADGENPYELMIAGCGLSFERWLPIRQVIWIWNERRLIMAGERL